MNSQNRSELIDLLSLAINIDRAGFSIWRAVRDQKGSIESFRLLCQSNPDVNSDERLRNRVLGQTSKMTIESQVTNGDLEKVKHTLISSLETFTKSPKTTTSKVITSWYPNTISTVMALTKDEVLVTHSDGDEFQKVINSNSWLLDHDPLTGLVDDVILDELLAKALLDHQLTEETFAFGIINIDNFTRINSKYGRETGDLLLRDFAELLKAKLGRSDTIIRLSSDDFAIILKNTHELSEITSLIKDLLKTAAKGWRHNGQQLKLTFSAGFVLVTHNHVDSRDIYTQAESEMFKVKNAGKNGVSSITLRTLAKVN